MKMEKGDQLKWEKLVSSQIALWEVKKKLALENQTHKSDNPWQQAFITISRTFGAGGIDTANELGNILNWQVYDRELVQYIAETTNVRSRIVESLDEKRQNDMSNWMQTILDREALGNDKYFQHLIAVLVAIAEHGQAIIFGRGANFVLHNDFSMRVFITAPLECRIDKIALTKKLSLKEAKKLVMRVDKERMDYIKRFFRKDPNDPLNYDMVINSSETTPYKTAKTIIAALDEKLEKPISETLNTYTEKILQV